MVRFAFYSVLFLFFASCRNSNTLFERISSDKSGIHFNNTINQTDSINVLDFANVYNGGGVGIGDFNKDGLQDIYFTGNMVSNKLYLNKGDFTFKDITEEAKVNGEGRWGRGVSVVDINNDGWDDIYVCASIKKKAKERENLLYVNQGLNKKGIPIFKEMGAEYGLNDTTHSTMANFFDYDNDGDLDVFIVVNEIIDGDYPNRFRPRLLNGEHPSTGRLYRNDPNEKLGHPVFADISKAAGILIEGYGHSVSVADINKDGWKDVYVANDYLSNNVLYINNRDGTFTDKLASYFKHGAANAMGSDIIDINNDGLADLVELDMNPEDNYRKKMMTNGNNYQTYQNIEQLKYQYQYVRNMLQINQGPRINQNDSIGDPIFSELSYFAGVAETDWSWAPVVADFDNDGFRDIFVTNGFPKDVTDHDFITFRNTAYSIATKAELLAQIPEVKIPNYAFQNKGNLTFANVSKDWGFNDPSFSNGAVYADLDNDGDLDVVLNNINDEAFLYRNNTQEETKDNHYLKIGFSGDRLNRKGVGTLVEIYYDHGKQQVWESTPYRGYLSSMQNVAHFGLGNISTIDSVLIKWPNGKVQIMQDVKVNQLISADIARANDTYSFQKKIFATSNLFREVTDSVDINHLQKEMDFVDFNIQKLLPHKFSEYGPALAVGDIDNDGLDDIISGGSFSFSAQIFLQKANGRFVQKALIQNADIHNKRWEDLGLLLFDADGDGDLDLYAASGGYENERNTSVYQDKLYVNDGKANFKLDETALPQNFTSKLCVRAIDYDKDGDLDLFVAGRVDPWNYPKPVSSFIFRNDSRKGEPKFTDVTKNIARDLVNIGLVCDAVFTDFDNDGWQDLILAGEWMPVTLLKNEKGVFKNVSTSTGISDKVGWWNTIAPGDFDNDGDIDYVVGNLGQNSFYKGSDNYPVSIIANDLDNNGSYDAIPFLFLPDQTGEKKEFPAHTRDDMIKQIIGTRIKFQNYKSFAVANMDDIFTPEQVSGALKLKANYFQSSYIENLGKGKFSIKPLPMEAQVSVLNGILVDDFTGDGNLDIVVNGNDYGTEVSVGRYDALNGLVLKGDGKGNFKSLSILESGIFIPGNGKAIVKLKSSDGKYLLAASQNRGNLKVYSLKAGKKNVPVRADDVSAVIKFRNGKTQKREIPYGSSFLSQSGRFLTLDNNVISVVVTNTKSESRKVL
ncbi:VCBS repeat-containing protein [Daejeonella sp.]|uniref:VCBS repeat-containing protein n=1 Tax=Daejeonella sp. TaxID=2805397 RepID=UPI003983C772